MPPRKQEKVEEKKTDPVKEPARKFDYQFVPLPLHWSVADKSKKLDDLGLNGWELVCFQGEIAIMKRLLK